MADTYFEVRNKDNVFQFSDNTHLLHIAKSIEFIAEQEKGEIYGVEIPKGISGISYWTREGVLYISPETVKDGKRIQYVTSSMDAPIKAYFWSEDYFPEMEHGAGLELRNARGEIVFNNQGFLGSFRKSFYAGVTTFQKIVSTENNQQKLAGFPDVYYAPGFPMLYLALAVRFWGTYTKYDVSYSSDKKWFHTTVSRETTLHGYSFGDASGKPADTSNSACRWNKFPHRGEFGKRSMERFIYSDPPQFEDRYWRGNDYFTKTDWQNAYGNAKPDYITQYPSGLDAGIYIRIDNGWDYVTTSSASLMCPMNIWLPSLVGPEKDKNCCYAVGYEFININGQRHIRMTKEFEILRLKTVKGAGTLEHLNRVVASGTENGGWRNVDGEEFSQFLQAKYIDSREIHFWEVNYYENNELVATRYNRDYRIKDDGGTWVITDGLACDVSMCHIVDTV